MDLFTSRCGCGVIVKLPSAKARGAQCEACVDRARLQARAASPKPVEYGTTPAALVPAPPAITATSWATATPEELLADLEAVLCEPFKGERARVERDRSTQSLVRMELDRHVVYDDIYYEELPPFTVELLLKGAALKSWLDVAGGHPVHTWVELKDHLLDYLPFGAELRLCVNGVYV